MKWEKIGVEPNQPHAHDEDIPSTDLRPGLKPYPSDFSWFRHSVEYVTEF